MMNFLIFSSNEVVNGYITQNSSDNRPTIFYTMTVECLPTDCRYIKIVMAQALL